MAYSLRHYRLYLLTGVCTILRLSAFNTLLLLPHLRCHLPSLCQIRPCRWCQMIPGKTPRCLLLPLWRKSCCWGGSLIQSFAGSQSPSGCSGRLPAAEEEYQKGRMWLLECGRPGDFPFLLFHQKKTSWTTPPAQRRSVIRASKWWHPVFSSCVFLI